MRAALAFVGVNVRKYWDATPAALSRFIPKPDAAALSAAQEFVAQFVQGGRNGLYFYSKREGDRLAAGCGKTFLSIGIIRALLEHDMSLKDRIRFAYVPEVVDDYRRLYDEHTRPENLDEKYLWPELLVLDDMGAQRMTEYATEILNRIIYRREGKATIYTSNLSLAELEDRDPSGYIERATSRIAGECSIVKMTGPDRRISRVA
jgi:DNA replication protein DnaC